MSGDYDSNTAAIARALANSAIHGDNLTLSSIQGTSIVLLAANDVGGPGPRGVSQKDKVIQCVIQAGYTAASVNVEGSNDGINWDLINNFTANGTVINNDPYRMLHAHVVSKTGAGATAISVVTAKKLTGSVIAGGSLVGTELDSYLELGTLWVITDTTFSAGEWVLCVDAPNDTGFQGISLPIIDVGSSESILFDFGGLATAGAIDGTVSFMFGAIVVTVGE